MPLRRNLTECIAGNVAPERLPGYPNPDLVSSIRSGAERCSRVKNEVSFWERMRLRPDQTLTVSTRSFGLWGSGFSGRSPAVPLALADDSSTQTSAKVIGQFVE